jgi:small subunit ribosomal protein S6
MTDYETMVIVDAMISEEAISKELSAIETILKEKGEIKRIDNWGKRKMAYEINKKSHGHYTVFFYQASTDVVETLEKDFRINENILRWITLADQPMSDVPRDDDDSDLALDAVVSKSRISEEEE